MPDFVPGVVQTTFRLAEGPLGPEPARYRDGLKAWKLYHAGLESRLSGYDEEVAALSGTEAEIKAKAAAVYERREAAYQKLAASLPSPPDPGLDPSIPSEAKRFYHLLENSILDKARKDIPNITVILSRLEAWATEISAAAEARLSYESARADAAQRKAERKYKRRKSQASIAGYVVTVVGTVASFIPKVGQIVSALVQIIGNVAIIVYEVDAQRRYGHRLRDSVNALLSVQPSLTDDLTLAENNLDYLSGLSAVADSLVEPTDLRIRLNNLKVDADVYSEKALLAGNATVPGVFGAPKWLLFAGGAAALALFAWRRMT